MLDVSRVLIRGVSRINNVDNELMDTETGVLRGTHGGSVPLRLQYGSTTRFGTTQLQICEETWSTSCDVKEGDDVCGE